MCARICVRAPACMRACVPGGLGRARVVKDQTGELWGVGDDATCVGGGRPARARPHVANSTLRHRSAKACPAVAKLTLAFMHTHGPPCQAPAFKLLMTFLLLTRSRSRACLLLLLPL